MPCKLFAQSGADARSMVMGGGSAYLTGFESNFYNPANLMIPDYSHTTEIELGAVSVQLNRRPVNRVFVPYQGFVDQFLPNHPGGNLDTLGNRQRLLKHWFTAEGSKYQRLTLFESTPIGASFRHGSFAYSIGIHNRAINSFELTQGWFTGDAQSISAQNGLARDLKQTIATYQEISVGLAQEVTLIDGWTPKLNRLFVGIAPKFILPGMFMEADYQSDYQRDKAGEIIQTRAFKMLSAGAVSTAWNGESESLGNSDLISPTGWGLGLDMGLTYVKSLGNDIALLRGKTRTALRKSIRISISLTDVGFVRYSHQAASVNNASEKRTVQQLSQGPANEFTGSPIQYLSYLQADGASMDYLQTHARNNIRIALPTALHAGAAYQDNWWMLTGDLTYSLNKNTFNYGGWITDAGAEIRPLHFLPIRAGLQWHPGHHLIFATGLGIDTEYASLDFGARFSAPSTNRGFYLMGAAITTLRIHF